MIRGILLGLALAVVIRLAWRHWGEPWWSPFYLRRS